MTETVNEIFQTLIDETWVSETDADDTTRTQFHFTSDNKFTFQFFDDGNKPVLTKGRFEIKSHDGGHFLKTISDDNEVEEAEITDFAENRFTLTGDYNQSVRYVLLLNYIIATNE